MLFFFSGFFNMGIWANKLVIVFFSFFFLKYRLKKSQFHSLEQQLLPQNLGVHSSPSKSEKASPSKKKRKIVTDGQT